MLITFSGLDGSGKTTLIAELKKSLEKANYRVQVLTMYDDISFYSFIRTVRYKIFGKPSAKAGAEIKAAARKAILYESSDGLRDPKIGAVEQKGPMARFMYSIVRSVPAKKAALFLDLVCLVILRFYHEKIRNCFLITDRYIYDSLADVADLQSKRWTFLRFFMILAPKPDLPVFVDIEPETAYARKMEYPVSYMRWRRDTYRKIFSWLKNPLVVFNKELPASVETLLKATDDMLSTKRRKQKEVFVYSFKSKDARPDAAFGGQYETGEFSYELWRPSLTKIMPRGLFRLDFIAWWFFNFAGVFAKKEYGVFVVRHNGRLAHYTAVFPKYFRFPFMRADDIQLGSAYTLPAYRRRGLLYKSIIRIIELHGKPGRTFWWICKSTNLPSSRAAEKAGFSKEGIGYREKYMGLKMLGRFMIRKYTADQPDRDIRQ